MSTTMNTAGAGTQSVERALSLLSYFTDEQPERRIAELVELTGLGQSTISRLVGALESLGYLARDERSGLHRLGPRVVTLAGIALNQSPVHRAARQIAQNLAHETGLGANVAERHGSRMFYLCHFEGPQAPRSFTLTGRYAPLHATAMGKALIAGLSEEEIRGMMSPDFPAYTPQTITTIGALLTELDEVRSRGYATEVEELAFGRACLAVPVRDRSGEIVAALSVSGSLSALDLAGRQTELARQVIEYADQVSTGLGYLAHAV
ncbi:IclR family transcriptional regulator [Streptomyces sp. PSKA54]|uniref:IclR family transcriptional regulator n=1 Tax=Streptomyces himalayensis subsp. aureolus TaxID=2758039 RepID=A0A7W2D7V8_9ACTN|nr:IclR family transcriptional regulator [Streptomyces himalayensis]MBA4866080.1 IclR family transcriptional regulator [Streptomyces himalayensis subsp. aureolus]